MTEFELFADALEVAGLVERRALLARVCGDDGAMRKRVERLLRLHEANSGFMHEPSATTPDAMPATALFNQPEAATSPSGVVEVREKELAKDDPTKPMTHNLASQGASAPGLGGEHIRELTHPGSLKLESPPAMPGFGNFEIEQTIGKGGMGIVLKAHDKKLKRDVAIKVLAPHLAADAEAVQRFFREAQAAAAVRHDNVVTIHAVDEANGIPFLVMELINGESLQDRMKRGPLPVDEIVQYGIQIASGLEAAHRRGLIHRDIKPANILLDRDESPESRVQSEPHATNHSQLSTLNSRLKITDFGLARVMSESAITRSGFIAGTPQYMSPEQANGKPLDHRSDLFSLGSVLYSLCTGQAAFHAESAIVVLRRVTDHEPEPIRSLNPAIPDWLCEVIAKLMAKRPEDRIQSAKEVADLLTRCQAPSRERRDESTATYILPVGQRVVPDASSLEKSLTTARLPTSSITPQDSSRGPMTATLKRTLIAVALLAGVVLAVVFGRGRDPKSMASRSLPSASRGASAPGSSAAESVGANDGRRLTHPGSPGADGGSPEAEDVSHDAATAPPRAIAPFNAEQARQHQEVWAAHLNLPVESTNSIGMKFRRIPPGEFLMGSTPEEIEAALKVSDSRWQEHIQSEGPQHKVIFSKSIYVGVTEVTQSQYQQVMEANSSHFSATGKGNGQVANLETGNHPVEMVSWNDAADFCAKLSQQEKLKPFYSRSDETVTLLEGGGYRLPTEAEWEYACRAGTTTRFASGDQDQNLISAGWHSGNAGNRTHAAAESNPNPFGLSDMHGNVWEWVQDGWDPAFYSKFQMHAALDPSRPFLADQDPRPLRGGDYTDHRNKLRVRLLTREGEGYVAVIAPCAVKGVDLQRGESRPATCCSSR